MVALPQMLSLTFNTRSSLLSRRSGHWVSPPTIYQKIAFSIFPCKLLRPLNSVKIPYIASANTLEPQNLWPNQDF